MFTLTPISVSLQLSYKWAVKRSEFETIWSSNEKNVAGKVIWKTCRQCIYSNYNHGQYAFLGRMSCKPKPPLKLNTPNNYPAFFLNNIKNNHNAPFYSVKLGPFCFGELFQRKYSKYRVPDKISLNPLSLILTILL